MKDFALAANTIRGLAMDAVQKAASGHPGMPMGMADVAAVLWFKHLKVSPANPRWPDRDRFVLSAGHGSMLLYSLLHLAGYDMPMAELKTFRQGAAARPATRNGDTPTAWRRRRGHWARGVETPLAWRWPSACWPCVSTRTGFRRWIITPMCSAAMATSWKAFRTRRSRSPATWVFTN